MINDFYTTLGLSPTKSLNKQERLKLNKFVFNTCYVKKMTECETNGFIVELDDKEIKYLENLSKKLVEAKTKEWGATDNKNRYKREMTGCCIEYAVLKYFGKENLFDNTVVDASYKKAYPDLIPLGILCEIKGSFIGNVPLVFKKTRTFYCKHPKYFGKPFKTCNLIGVTDHKKVWLLGVASPQILELYSDDNLVVIAENSTKTGFYGVDKLDDIPKKWSDFKKICSDKSLPIL